MKNWFASLLHPEDAQAASRETIPPLPTESEDLLELQKEAQALRMELATRDQTIENLNQEVERLRLRQEQVIAETVAARLGSLFNDLAAPASQILTQGDLLERQGKPIQARDVLQVARRMVRALERHGIAFVGQVGEQVAFDPNHHTPLRMVSGSGAAAISGGEAAPPQPGQPVTVRFAAVVYQGKTIYKAIVE